MPPSNANYEFLLLLLSFYLVPVFTQTSPGLIYGEVVLKNGATYEGQLRWEDEEAFWDDIFDAYKYEEPTGQVLLTDRGKTTDSQTDQFSFGFMDLWEDKHRNINFSFRCHFGDMVSLEMIDSRLARLRLKNGHTVRLNRKRAGDLDEDIRLYQPASGRIDLSAVSIASIHFKAAPAGFVSPLGEAMYGQVLTTQGIFEGFITWDSEECLSKDLISGRNKGVKMNIAFGDIVTLSAQEDGSLLQLRSGSTLFLNDHDDVDRGNHGILIRDLAFGKLEISWDNFISVSFLESSHTPRTYADFRSPQWLVGKVTAKNGRSYRGRITYDLDERYDIEILNGKNNGFTYHIPFRMVNWLAPQNDKYTSVGLRDGTQLLLGGHSDVTSDNHGLIVYQADSSKDYLSWNEIKSVHFE